MIECLNQIRKRGLQELSDRALPGGSVVKNPPANAGDTGSIPGSGRSHMGAEQLSPCTTATEPVL